MSPAGNMGALSQDVAGLVNYTQLLIEGTGAANKAGNRPLGNKFFLKTGGQCKAASDGSSQDRYVYIDNVPNGSIPFLSSAMGSNFSTFRGLVPGAIGDAQVFRSGDDPWEVLVLMEWDELERARQFVMSGAVKDPIFTDEPTVYFLHGV